MYYIYLFKPFPAVSSETMHTVGEDMKMNAI